MKRRLELVGLVCAGCFLLSHASPAQWVQTNGPWGGSVTCFSIKGNAVFAGTLFGVFSSTDNGNSWTNVYPRTSDLMGFADSGRVLSLLVNGNDIYAGTRSGLYLSTDNGADWTFIKPVASLSGLPRSSYSSLTLIGNTFFARTGFGINRSNDNFATWTEVDAGLHNWAVCLAACDSTLFAGCQGGVYRSTDYGDSWSAANSGMDTTVTVNCLAVKGGVIFAGTATRGIFRSSNNGDSWKAVNSGLARDSVSYLYVSGNTIFAVINGNSVFHSTDNGDSWTGGNVGPAPGIKSLVMCGGALFAGVSVSGVFRSADSGSSWSLASSGILRRPIKSLGISGNNIFADTYDGQGSFISDGTFEGHDIFLSTDNGDNWKTICSGFANGDNRYISASGNDAFLSTRGSGIFRFTYNEPKWTTAIYYPGNNYVNALEVSGDTMIAGTDGGIFLSTDNGINWKPADTGSAVFSLAASGNAIAAGTVGGIKFSTDNGMSWTSSPSAFPNYAIRNIAVKGNTLFAAIYKFDASGNLTIPNDSGGIFSSSDYGSTWSNIGPKGVFINYLAASKEDIFALTGSTGGGVLRSTDDGSTWDSFNQGLGNQTISTIGINADFIFTCGGNGVWRRPLRDKVTSSISKINPAEDFQIHLLVIARQKVKLEFSLLHPAKVAFSIFNLLGKKMEFLKDTNLGAGSYSFVWDTRAIAQGCYAARFIAGTRTSVKFLNIFH